MMRWDKLRAGVALAGGAALTLQAGLAQAAAPSGAKCVERAEVAGLVGFALPTVLNAAISKCTPALGDNAYLVARGPRLVASLNTGKDASWPMAKQAFVKIGGGPEAAEAFAMLSDQAIKPIVEEVFAAKFVEEIPTESCKDVDSIMAALEPLPAANLVQVLTEALMIAGRKDKKLSTCRD